MDSRIRTLIDEHRLEAAAALATELGYSEDASRLWERACQFERAARCALDADDASRALLLAARVHATELEDEAIGRLAQAEDLGVVHSLRQIGRPATAARLLLARGDPAAAALDFEEAGKLRDAAAAHERANAPRDAARCLEAHLRVTPDDHPARIQLGGLLLCHRRFEPALRVLQVIPEAAPERAAALPLLHDALSGLGLLEAARKAAEEMQERGVEVIQPATPAKEKEAPGRVLFGRYVVAAEVARTPTARVLRALDRVSGEIVAVKLFSARALRDVGRDALRRFEREARVLGELHHRAIVPLHAYHPEGPALVLPWMGGGSLADLLDAAPMAPARASEIVITVLDALHEAHRRGFLHRDVKPANVLFDDAGLPYLADFGTAHISDAATTVTAGLLGTLAYMAPEQRAGAPATLASDVYGAGALFWHALTGAPPGMTTEFLSPELTESQAAVARRLIAPETQRPQDAAAARALVQSVTWPRGVPAPRSAPPRSTPAPRQTGGVRLTPLGATLHHDQLLGRDVHVLRTDRALLERAAAFARADHPRLAAVLCCREDSRILWVEAISGPPPTLDSTDIEALREALLALHRAGGHHGQVDFDHVVRRGNDVMFRFPLAPQGGSAEQDLAALETMAV